MRRLAMVNSQGKKAVRLVCVTGGVERNQDFLNDVLDIFDTQFPLHGPAQDLRHLSQQAAVGFLVTVDCGNHERAEAILIGVGQRFNLLRRLIQVNYCLHRPSGKAQSSLSRARDAACRISRILGSLSRALHAIKSQLPSLAGFFSGRL